MLYLWTGHVPVKLGVLYRKLMDFIVKFYKCWDRIHYSILCHECQIF